MSGDMHFVNKVSYRTLNGTFCVRLRGTFGSVNNPAVLCFPAVVVVAAGLLAHVSIDWQHSHGHRTLHVKVIKGWDRTLILECKTRARNKLGRLVGHERKIEKGGM